jgi:S-methylmethionine-dependent homocysteine/selenocysteine methylase/SAM-dependent methyltransferase
VLPGIEAPAAVAPQCDRLEEASGGAATRLVRARDVRSGWRGLATTDQQPSPVPPRVNAYRHIEEMIAAGRCVVLDGGVATELQRLRPLAGERGPDPELWGTWALYRAPEAVHEVHRRYLAAGANVLSTNTWSILSAPEVAQRAAPGRPEGGHWMDLARLGVRIARAAVAEAGKECAVAFAISEEVNSPERQGTIELLGRVFADEPPDLVLLETMTLVRDPATFNAVESLLETGLPVWLSFRRCRHGVCGVYGQHWGPPEGDLFGRAARRFEDMGVSALLINCLPVDHVPGMLSWLRDFTELPLGVYPNLGHLAGPLWRFDERVDPQAYADLARTWREEGAQIVGGCCGTTPEHIAAVADALAETKPGRRRPAISETVLGREPNASEPPTWLDGHDRVLFPLPFPELTIDPGVFVPTHGSFLCWKYLFSEVVGAGRTCLDVGCGCGILAVQLALNGASRVQAIDVDRNAVANTLANAFRNGVAHRVSADVVDLYEWESDTRYDVVVASLYQMPVDPFEERTGHRPLDYWGRTLLDHLLRILPSLLAPHGKAYVMQLSIVGQRETARQLKRLGLESRVVDFSFFPFGRLFMENREQIRRVEELSDAYHLVLGGDDVVVAYLLEVTHAGRHST